MSIPAKYIQNYFKRFAEAKPILEEPISGNCHMIVVIPCFNEPDLLGTLNNLLECDPPKSDVEVIMVVNDSELTEPNSDVRRQNLKAIADFTEWKNTFKSEKIHFHLIEALNLPAKTAGVGLARKIGMDEALRRFVRLNIDGTIICLDADCRVSRNYLKTIESEFHHSTAALGHVNFKHRCEEETNPELQRGIQYYEEFLTYYVNGLKNAAFPYAIQTIGSCMLIKASVYAKHGGMNKRKAGEDFYFLHKIVPHEEFKEVQEAWVYPSCRTSDRVPFGTGKAQQDWLNLEEKEFKTYDPRVFLELKKLISCVSDLYSNGISVTLEQLDIIPKTFIQSHQYQNKIELIRKNCKNSEQFEHQFFTWFDGFLCLKFVHWARDNYYSNIEFGPVQ